jgi:hypothetical protein
MDMIDFYIEQLKAKKVIFEQGLSPSEIDLVEAKFGICFPPDLKLFLQTALPISKSFVNWRAGLHFANEEKEIISRIQWPWDGLLFDLENSGFWHPAWGEVPKTMECKIEIAKKHFHSYPKLVPIYSHRYIPCRPNEVDNPIFSVYQMDVIYYGNNLADYFSREFHLTLPSTAAVPHEPKYIEFWSDYT